MPWNWLFGAGEREVAHQEDLVESTPPVSQETDEEDAEEVRTDFRSQNIIIGIDYGTTYTGVAIIQEGEPSKNVQIFTNWAGSTHTLSAKVPSRIAYAAENPNQERDLWGYEVSSDSKGCLWTKLLLDRQADHGQYDDPQLNKAIAKGMLHLPPGKSASQVVTDFLSHVHSAVIEELSTKLGKGAPFDSTPIEYWLTVPAIWSEEAKSVTRHAAVMAGIGSRAIDRLGLITEPEAAIVCSLSTMTDQTKAAYRRGRGLMVVDVGGGTTDLVSYTIQRLSPRLVLKETAYGQGAKCGGTYVDRNFYELMAKRFGAAFTGLPLSETGPGSSFMNEFERQKQDFRSDWAKKSVGLPLVMPGLSPVLGYSDVFRKVQVSKADFQACFQPVIDNILRLMQEQVAQVAARSEPRIETVVLAGGLSMCKQVSTMIEAWCSNRDIRVMRPWNGSWDAIARGAALHGLEQIEIRERIMRRHYGIAVGRPVEPGDEEGPLWATRFHDPWSKVETYIEGKMLWLVAKGTVFTEETEIEVPFTIISSATDRSRICSVDLFSYPRDTPTRHRLRPDIQKVGRLVVDWTDLDINQFESKVGKDSVLRHRVQVQVFVRLGARKGLLTFRATVGEKNCGKVTMDFLEH